MTAVKKPAALPPIVCQGRPTNDHGQPVGDPCGNTYSARPRWNGERFTDATPVEQADEARAAGWSVTGPPMCPGCRRPDPTIARNLIRPTPRKDPQP